MTIHEIDQSIRDVIENGFSFDEETGEILFDETNFNELQEAQEKKREGIALMYKEFSAEADAIGNEVTTLNKRKKTAQNKAEYMKMLLETSLQGEKFKTSRVDVSYRKSEQVEIEEGAELPKEYLRYKDPEPDKVGLKKALKAGEEIPGCSLITKNNMSIK